MPPLKASSPILSDEEIVARVLGGEKELYELIMRRHNQRLFRVCRAYAGSDDDAEDIVQEAHVRAWADLPRFRGESLLSTWLTRIVINEALRRVKRGKRMVPLSAAVAGNDATATFEEAAAPNNETPLAITMRNELQNVTDRALDGIPEKYRVVFLMRAIEGMSVAETSECLNISEANVKVRLNRARSLLKKRIGAAYGEGVVYHFDLVRCDRIVANVLHRIGGA